MTPPAATSQRPVVLSVEQALSMSYATLRMVHLGWRVIRVEATPVKGRRSKGDPNRFIGRPVGGEDRHSYFVAPNVGKEAIALNLKEQQGRELLQRLLTELPVDVFCTNTLPAHHAKLGIDYATLSAVRPELIWCCISAMGTAYPDVPGHDPMMQALCGFMDITGHADGPPLQCGPPLTDLKAGDEAFTQVILALMQRQQSGMGKMVDVSMAQAGVSWLLTFLPMLDMGSPPSELRRAGNEHRQFIPVNAFPTKDGFTFIALGSDAQWQRFVKIPMFASLDEPRFGSNEGRRNDKDELRRRMTDIAERHESDEVNAALAAAAIPHAPITPVEGVMDLPFVAEQLLTTEAPGGQEIRLPPPAVPTPWLQARGGRVPFAPSYGQHTDALLKEVGADGTDIAKWRNSGVIA